MKAVFLDRDGVINELIYHREQGIIDSPFTAEQLSIFPGAGEAVRNLNETDYMVILVSNQPGIAKGSLTGATFEEIRNKMQATLAAAQAGLDGEYYCYHHPEAKIEKYRVICECRKPKPGLLLQAARDMGIDLSQSWMIGDGLTDIQAGKRAGCRTILIGRMKCELCAMMDEQDCRPDFIASDLQEAVKYILEKGDQTWKSSLIQPASMTLKNG